MNTSTKNKLLTWLVVLLLAANTATIISFWLGRNKRPPISATPADYLIKELGLNAQQQQQYLDLVTEHRKVSEQIRIKIREAKNDFFDLLKQAQLPDSIKKATVETIASHTRELDLLTFDHFVKVRALCNVEQQKKFDAVIRNMINMMAAPRPGVGPHGPPPHNGRPSQDEGSMPPPQQ